MSGVDADTAGGTRAGPVAPDTTVTPSGEPASVSLEGGWRAAPSDPALARRFHEPDHDDTAWVPVPVPGHWRQVPQLAPTDGPVCYRRRVTVGPRPDGARRFVTFDGVCASADVWCDGAYLGATDGYFVPHTFELEPGAAGADAGEHLLALEVHCHAETPERPRHGLLGALTDPRRVPPGWNPGGIWRPARIHHTGPVRLAALTVGCPEAAAERAVLAGRLRLDAGGGGARSVRIHLTVTEASGDVLAATTIEVAALAAGDTELPWTLPVDRPPLWWPWRLGAQPLVELTVEVRVDGRPSDGRRVRTGLRSLRRRDWRLEVNGVPLFVLGAATGPHRPDLAAATPDALAADVRLAREANLDLLRLHAHVSRPETYRAADELGILVWQDLPLQGRAARTLRRPATRQAGRLVEVLGHHPSVAWWCAHDAPWAPLGDPAGAGTARRARHLAARLAPSWTREVLDRAVARTLRHTDPTRPVVRASGLVPGLFSTGTDWHAGLGWHTGTFDGLAGRARLFPRLVRFVDLCGAPAAPETGTVTGRDPWPPSDRPAWAGSVGVDAAAVARHVPPEAFDTFEAWRDATQSYQAALVQLQTEDLRRLRHRPTGGCCHLGWVDARDGLVSSALLDAARVPKAGFAAMRAAGRSVLPMLDPRRGHLHVANETGDAYPGALLAVRLGERTWRFTGDVAPRSVTYVGRVRVPAGLGDGDPAWVRLTHPTLGEITNDYTRVLGWLRIVHG